MKSYLQTHLMVAMHALTLALVVCGTAWYVHTTQADTRSLLEENIRTHSKTIADIAELTDRNGADEVTESIIADCPRRSEFETQLGTLNTATKKELVSIQQLFESCGAFYAERKALMVSRLEREFVGLENDLLVLATIRDLTQDELSLHNWKTLIELERNRSALLTEQVAIQQEIITLLMSGTNTNSPITLLIQRAQELGESLSVTGAQIDTLRASLIQ